MHACLNVDEILRFIANELVESGSWQTAVALACCCRAFEDPVLDVLWETEDCLTHLLGTFPQDIWDPGEPKVSVLIVVLFPSLLKYLIVKVSHQAPYSAGVGSFAEVRTKNKNALAVGSPATASPLGSAVSYPRESPASEPETFGDGCHTYYRGQHLIHPSISLPKDNHRRTQIRRA